MGNWDNLVSGMLNRQPSGVDRSFNRGLDQANLEQQQMQQRLQNDLQRGQSVNLGRLIGQNAYQKDLPQKDIIGAMAQQDPQSALKMSGLMGGNSGGLDPTLNKQLLQLRNIQQMIANSNFSSLPKQAQESLLSEADYLKNQIKQNEAGSKFYGQAPQTQATKLDPIDLDVERAFVRNMSKNLGKDGRISPESKIALEDRYSDLVLKHGENDSTVQALRASIDNAYNINKEEVSQSKERKKEGQDDYKYYVETNLPNIASARGALNKVRSGLQSALTQGKRAPAGGAYIAMKKILGDAITGGDFAGVAGFDVQQGMLGKLKEMFNASQMTDEQAMEIIESSVDSFNESLNDYNDRFDDSSSFGKKAKRAYGVKPLSVDFSKKAPKKEDAPSDNKGMSRLERIRALRAKRSGK